MRSSAFDSGGIGGSGGLITVYYPSGYDTSRITTDVSAGPAGDGGSGGLGGRGGSPARRGGGGVLATVTAALERSRSVSCLDTP